MRVKPDQRHTRWHPCRICNGFDGMPRGNGERCAGYLEEERGVEHCEREPSPWEDKNATPPTYAHKLYGDCPCGTVHNPAQGAQAQQQNRIVALYDYYKDGKLLYQAVRYDPKHFKQRRPDGKGNWIWTLDGVERVLFHRDAVLAAPTAEIVLHLEGEKDVLRAEDDRFTATTTAQGAKSWEKTAEDAREVLRGRHVVILPDADDDGDVYAASAAAGLHGVAASVKIVRLPGLEHREKHGEDYSDWREKGHTGEELRQLIAETPEWQLEPEEDAEPESPADVAPFPVEAFPEVLQRLIREAAVAFPCPPDLIGLPLLALAGSAIGNSRCLELKQTWHELAILWAAIVAAPGAKKTPVLKMLRACWDARQRALARDYADAVKRYESDQREAKKAAGEGDNALSDAPVLKQAYVSDTTMEALADVLMANPRGVALIRDEMDGWIRAMNEYKRGGADRQNWLSLWSGESFPLNRRNRKQPIFVSDPFIGVVGGIQPDILPDLNDERGRQDGFVHRFLFAYPKPLPITGYSDEEVSRETLDALGNIFTRLWMLKPEDDADGTTHPVCIHLSRAAKRIWVRWNAEHADEQNKPSFPAVLSGPWQKMVSYAARLALIVHSLRWAAQEPVGHDVDEQSMAAACDLVEYFKSHARRVYTLLHMSADDKRALAAIEWIRRQPGQKATSRAIQRCHVGGVKTAEEAKTLLMDLVERGYGFASEATSRGGKSVVFTIRSSEGAA